MLTQPSADLLNAVAAIVHSTVSSRNSVCFRRYHDGHGSFGVAEFDLNRVSGMLDPGVMGPTSKA